MRKKPDLEELKMFVAMAHREWIEVKPEGTLGQLKERIDTALEQCLEMDSSELIEEYPDDDIPEPLNSELAKWDNAVCTVEDRQGDLQDLADDLNALVETLGPDFKVSDLPKPSG